jgi:hypothetical protein
MKKLCLFGVLCVLVLAIAGCPSGKMVFEKDKTFYQINDDDTSLSGPILSLPPPPANYAYGFPDVSHDGSKVAFVLDSNGMGYGILWTMNRDGTGLKQITPNSIPPSTSPTRMPKWYPDQSLIAYSKGAHGIWKVAPNLSVIAEGEKICDTGIRDSNGFDINKPLSGPLQLIFSHHETGDSSYKLYRLNTVSCIRTPVPPVQTQLGVPVSDIGETFPAVSIAQDILVNAVKWGDNIGIRMRNIDQNGVIGLFPVTMRLQGFTSSFNITGLSMAGESNAIYFSAQLGSSNSQIYVIAAKEYVAILRNMISSPPGVPPPPVGVTPKKLMATGPDDSRWPSGINEPQ